MIALAKWITGMSIALGMLWLYFSEAMWFGSF
jgi:hypothetical protein